MSELSQSRRHGRTAQPVGSGQLVGSGQPGRPGQPIRPAQPVLDRLFLLGVLASVAFVLWLPVFPTGDGPVHLYYADVLWSLVRHQPVYTSDYAVRHLVAPYLVHYLALVSLEQLVPPPVAEKLFIAIILLTQAFGFRFLARRLGVEAPVACVWMLPLLFSWSLGGGFLNCCFATGVALWAYGVWTLLGEAKAARAAGLLLLAFAGTLGVLVLAHPVPLLVLLLFTAGDMLLGALGRVPGQRLRWAQGGAFALTCCAFLAPVLLAQKGQAAAVVPGIGFHRDVLFELVAGMRLGLFAGLDVRTWAGWAAIVARAGLLAIVPGVTVLLARSARAGRRGGAGEDAASDDERELTRGTSYEIVHETGRAWLPWLASPAVRLLVISLGFLAATVFLPRSLNHSYFFPQRLWDIVWLLVLASGAAATLSARARLRLAAGGLVLFGLTAATGFPALAEIARAQQQLAGARLPAGGRGLFLEPASAEDGHGAATTYPVYAWAGVRAFEASHAILLNSPWLGLTILPVRDSAAPGARPLLDQGLPSIESESPIALTRVLAGTAPRAFGTGASGPGALGPGALGPDRSGDRKAILARADFLLYSNPASLGSAGAAERTRAAVLALLGAESAAWQCEARSFYAVCLHTR